MKSDKFLGHVLILFMLCIVATMVFKGLMYWWIPLLIMFLLIAIYAEDKAKKESEDAYDSFMRSDYYDSYEAPDEEIVMQKDSMWVNCKKCNNEVYQICMCKPVKKK